MTKRNYYKTDRRSRKPLVRKVIIAAVIIFALYRLDIAIFGEMGIIKYYRMNAYYDELTADIVKLKQDNARLTKEVHALKTNDYIEQIARDKMGLARPGEIVYDFGDQEKR